jgi:hypothetical protein
MGAIPSVFLLAQLTQSESQYLHASCIFYLSLSVLSPAPVPLAAHGITYSSSFIFGPNLELILSAEFLLR